VIHHGTLLVSSILDDLESILAKPEYVVSDVSVSSRYSSVANLSSFNPDITIDALKSVIIDELAKNEGTYKLCNMSDLIELKFLLRITKK